MTTGYAQRPILDYLQTDHRNMRRAAQESRRAVQEGALANEAGCVEEARHLTARSSDGSCWKDR
jgi:hypothetical protein